MGVPGALGPWPPWSLRGPKKKEKEREKRERKEKRGKERKKKEGGQKREKIGNSI